MANVHATRLQSMFRRDLRDNPAKLFSDSLSPPLLLATAAIIAGEPRRAVTILDSRNSDTLAAPEWAAAIRKAAYRLDNDWWPGDTSVPEQEETPADEATVARTGGARLDMLLAVPSQIEPDLMRLRRIARASARMHPEEAEELIRPASEEYEVLLVTAAKSDAGIAAAIAIELADLYRLCQARRLADERLAWARFAYDRLNDNAGKARCLLVEADWSVAPQTSVLTLGFDLDDLDVVRPVPEQDVALAARFKYREARRLFLHADASRGVAATHLGEGCLDMLLGDPAAAEDQFQQARSLSRQVGDTAAALLADVHATLAAISTGRLSAARPGPAPHIAGWARSTGSISYARGISRLVHAAGHAWRLAGDLERARVTLSFAIDIAAQLSATDAQVSVLVHDLAPLYLSINSLGPAITLYREALEACLIAIGGLNGTDPIEPAAWLRLSDVLGGMIPLMMADGDPEGLARVADLLRKLLARARRDAVVAGTPLGQKAIKEHVNHLLAAGVSSVLHGDPLPGIESFTLSIAAAHMTGFIALADVFVLIYRARGRRADGDLEGAHELFLAALTHARAQGLSGWRDQVSALVELDRYDEARRLMEHGLRDSQDLDLDPGQLAAEWEWVHAYDRAADAVRQIPGPMLAAASWRDLSKWGVVLAAAGDDDGAEPLLTRAIAAFEALVDRTARDAFRLSMMADGTAHAMYAVAAGVARRKGRLQDAFALADRLRCLRLDALLHDAINRGIGEPERSSALRRWSRASAEWTGAYDLFAGAGNTGDVTDSAKLRAFLDQSQRHLEAAESDLDRVTPGYLVTDHRVSPPSRLERVQALLPDDTLLLEFLVERDRLQIWAVDRRRARPAERPLDANEFDVKVRRFHDYCAGRRAQPDTRDAEWLGDALLDRVASAVRDHTRLVVVPSGPMNLLPLHSLPFDGDVLGVHHVISVIPASSVLAYSAGRDRPRLDRGAVVIGDPSYAPARGLPRLEGTLLEARRVAARYGVEPLLGDKAAEADVAPRMTSTAVIHLATHGLVSRTAPTMSSIALAGDDELTVADLMGLAIDADLVVLSACDTGRGEAAESGGVAGLVRGLLAAGARNAIVSLWPVDDEATCVLMDHFAKSVVEGTTVAEALAAAQLALRAMDADGISAGYRALAEVCDVSVPVRPVRLSCQRATRDVLRQKPATLEAGHPYWWAPFIHVGL